jgi:hypothetical protein
MKLADKTLTVLKSFSTINPSILIKEGSVLKTISPSKTVMATATVPNEFPKQFGIYQLARFLGAVSLVTDADLTFEDNHLVISDGKGKTTQYAYSDETVIVTPPDREIKIPSVDVAFKVTEGNFKEVVKATGVLGLPDVSVTGDGKLVKLQALDTKNPTTDVYSIDLGETDKTFRVVFKVENLLKLMNGSYDVEISAKGISRFTADGLEYFVAIESNSTFE